MKIILFTVVALVLTGCMTDKEAWLRNRDMDIKATAAVNTSSGTATTNDNSGASE